MTIQEMKKRAGSEDYITTEEMALILRFVPATIRAMCRRGEIPGAERFGRQWRIRRAAFMADRADSTAVDVRRDTSVDA